MSKRDWQEGKNCDKNRRKKETSGNGMEWVRLKEQHAPKI